MRGDVEAAVALALPLMLSDVGLAAGLVVVAVLMTLRWAGRIQAITGREQGIAAA